MYDLVHAGKSTKMLEKTVGDLEQEVWDTEKQAASTRSRLLCEGRFRDAQRALSEF